MTQVTTRHKSLVELQIGPRASWGPTSVFHRMVGLAPKQQSDPQDQPGDMQSPEMSSPSPLTEGQ